MERARMQWTGKLEFLFTTFGYILGLGNIWRFPYKCYVHGGGTFMIPYLLTLFLCSFPVMLLEMFMGQFSSEGPITVWKFCPLFKGVGWAILFNVFMTNINYVVVVMYALYYMLVAFVHIGGPLPWQHCEKSWATSQCRDEPYPNFDAMGEESIKIKTYKSLLNSTCTQTVQGKLNGSVDPVIFSEFKRIYASCEIEFHAPEEEYWHRFVLGAHESEGLHDLGAVVGRNAVSLLIVWLVLFYCCVKGIRHLAKVIYVTASFPFLLLLILFARGLNLQGHEVGIKYFTEMDTSKLSNMAIWSSAATQSMYSIGVAFGSHISLASYNKFNKNVFRDAIILATVNTLTSLFGGFVVFSFLGHASLILNRPIDKIFDQGPGLIFISYLKGISQLSGSAVWAFLFFMVVFTLGVDSMLVMVWTIYVAIEDVFPGIYKKKGTLILIAMCAIQFLLGFPLVTSGGIHLLVVMDRYTADFTITLFLIMETVSICWVYGVKRFMEDVEMMIGTKYVIFKWYWMVTWAVTAPAFGMFIFVASAVGYTSVSYNGIQTSSGGEAFGWILIVSPFLIMVSIAVYQIKKTNGIRSAIIASEDWGPRLSRDRRGRYMNTYIHPTSVGRRQESVRSETSFETLQAENFNFDVMTCEQDNAIRRISQLDNLPNGFEHLEMAAPAPHLNNKYI